MNQETLKAILKDEIKKRTTPAWEKMNELTLCKGMYEQLVSQYPKEMETFKSAVFWSCVLHPDWSELDILADIMKGTDIAEHLNAIR